MVDRSIETVALAALILVLVFLLPCEALWGEERMGLEVKWVFNISAQFADKIFGAGHQGAQTVWDIDGDGVKEIVFGTRRGDSKRIWCFDSNQRLEWVYPVMSEPGLSGDPVSKVSLVDVDSDGVFELCFAGRDGRLHVLDGFGEVVWVWDDSNSYGDGTASIWEPPQAFDVDGDGYVEFFVADDANSLHRLTHDGKLVWTTRFGNNNRGVTVCDIDRDGEYEVLVSGDSHYVYCVDARTGAVKWKFDTEAIMKPQPVVVADVNRDGEYEGIIWTDAGTVFCIDWSGKEIWRWSLLEEAPIRLCQAMGDVDNDGSMDLALMGWGAVYLVDIGTNPPQVKWRINFTEWSEEGLLPPGASVNTHGSYQTIADIDGDDELEILWLVPFPVITDATTGELEAYYTNEHVWVNRRQENGGWWGDVDDDGVSEWIVELNGHSHPETLVYCLTMGGKFPAESPWPEYYHSAYPAEYQNQQDWLTLKAAYSNSVWFPIPETGLLLTIPSNIVLIGIAVILIGGLAGLIKTRRKEVIKRRKK